MIPPWPLLPWNRRETGSLRASVRPRLRVRRNLLGRRGRGDAADHDRVDVDPYLHDNRRDDHDAADDDDRVDDRHHDRDDCRDDDDADDDHDDEAPPTTGT